MTKISPFPTSYENVALNLAFEYLGESRYNRTTAEYLDIANRLPPLKVLHALINSRLNAISAEGSAPYRICRFKPKDRSIIIEDFPRSLSIEVVRTALTKSGMRAARIRSAR